MRGPHYMGMKYGYYPYSIGVQEGRYESIIGVEPTTTIKLIAIVIHGSIPNAPLILIRFQHIIYFINKQTLKMFLPIISKIANTLT